VGKSKMKDTDQLECPPFQPPSSGDPAALIRAMTEELFVDAQYDQILPTMRDVQGGPFNDSKKGWFFLLWSNYARVGIVYFRYGGRSCARNTVTGSVYRPKFQMSSQRFSG
jgi:hypothetical protein